MENATFIIQTPKGKLNSFFPNAYPTELKDISKYTAEEQEQFKATLKRIEEFRPANIFAHISKGYSIFKTRQEAEEMLTDIRAQAEKENRIPDYAKRQYLEYILKFSVKPLNQ